MWIIRINSLIFWTSVFTFTLLFLIIERVVALSCSFLVCGFASFLVILAFGIVLLSLFVQFLVPFKGSFGQFLFFLMRDFFFFFLLIWLFLLGHFRTRWTISVAFLVLLFLHYFTILGFEFLLVFIRSTYLRHLGLALENSELFLVLSGLCLDFGFQRILSVGDFVHLLPFCLLVLEGALVFTRESSNFLHSGKFVVLTWDLFAPVLEIPSIPQSREREHVWPCDWEKRWSLSFQKLNKMLFHFFIITTFSDIEFYTALFVGETLFDFFSVLWTISLKE